MRFSTWVGMGWAIGTTLSCTGMIHEDSIVLHPASLKGLNFSLSSSSVQLIDAPTLSIRVPQSRSLHYDWAESCGLSGSSLAPVEGIVSIPVPEESGPRSLSLWFEVRGKRKGSCLTLPLNLGRKVLLDPLYSVPAGSANQALSWGTWITNDGGDVFSSSQTTCDTDSLSPDPCLHTGQMRKVDLQDLSSCDGISAQDSLQVFEWTCRLVSGRVQIYTTELKPFKGLRDLVKTTGWNPMRVEISTPTGFRVSDLKAWGSNPVSPVTAPGTTRRNLDSEGTVYVAADTAASAGYNIVKERISLVAERGKILQAAAGTLGGWITVDDGTTEGVKQTWLEVDVKGVPNTTGLRGDQFRNLTVRNSSFVGFRGTGTGGHFAPNSTVHSSYQLWISYSQFNSNGLGLFVGNNWVSNVSIETVVVAGNETNGLRTVLVNVLKARNLFSFGNGSSGAFVRPRTMIIENLMASDNGWYGLRIENSNQGINGDIVLKNAVLAFNGLEGLGRNTQSNAFFLEDSNLVNVTAAFNGLASATTGQMEVRSIRKSTLHNFLVAQNRDVSVPLMTVTTDGGSNAEIQNLNFSQFMAHTGLTASTFLDGPFAAPIYSPWRGVLWLQDMVCTGAASVGLVLGPCGTFEPDADKKTSSVTPSWQNLFDEPSSFAPNFSTIQPWPTSITQVLGPVQHSSPWAADISGPCVGATCAWWNLKPKDDLNNRAFGYSAGLSQRNALPDATQPCPAEYDDTNSLLDNRTPPKAYHRLATEILFDKIGNDDGLCQSGEACELTPHFGAYQGSGPLRPACLPSGTGPLAPLQLFVRESQ